MGSIWSKKVHSLCCHFIRSLTSWPFVGIYTRYPKEKIMHLNFKQYGIILAGLAAAFFHLLLFPDIAFTLNGLGYIGLLGAYFLPIAFFQQRHKIVWWGLGGYTLLTIVLWVIIADKQFVAGTSSATGYYAMISELVLLGFLWTDKSK
jgi:hypothetical protein